MLIPRKVVVIPAESIPRLSSYVSFLMISVLVLNLSGYPIVASITGLLGLDNRLVAFAFRILLLLGSVALIAAILTNRVRVYRGWVWVPMLVFWLVYLIRLILDTKIVVPPLSRGPNEYWMWAIGGCLLPLVALMARPNKATARNAPEAVLWVTGVAALLVLAAIAMEIVSGISRVLETGRLEISTLNPISAGHLGGTLVLISMYSFFRGGQLRNMKWKTSVLLLLILAGLILVVLSGSRGALGATAICAAVFGISKFHRRGGALAVVGIGLLAVGTYHAASLAEDRLGLLTLSRIASAMSPGRDTGASDRLELLSDSWDQFLEAPVLGSGLEESNRRDYPHNVVVESFMATGLVGGVAFLLIIISAAWVAVRAIFTGAPHGWLALICLQYLIGAQVSGSLWGNTVMWSLIGATFGYCGLSGSRIPFGIPRKDSALEHAGSY